MRLKEWRRVSDVARVGVLVEKLEGKIWLVILNRKWKECMNP
jgi:hypothetical protein